MKVHCECVSYRYVVIITVQRVFSCVKYALCLPTPVEHISITNLLLTLGFRCVCCMCVPASVLVCVYMCVCVCVCVCVLVHVLVVC